MSWLKGSLNAVIWYCWFAAFNALGWITLTSHFPWWANFLVLSIYGSVFGLLTALVVFVIDVFVLKQLGLVSAIVAFIPLLLLVFIFPVVGGWYIFLLVSQFSGLFAVNVDWWWQGLVMMILLSYLRIPQNLNSQRTPTIIPTNYSKPRRRRQPAVTMNYSPPQTQQRYKAEVKRSVGSPVIIQYCPTCGEQVYRIEEHCQTCGHYLGLSPNPVRQLPWLIMQDEPPAETTTAQTDGIEPEILPLCAGCGKQMPEKANFCIFCGAKSGVVPSTGVTTVLSKNQKQKGD